ncbi:hypothetical protein AMTR_s00052p00200930 [Amborella trichopoda]|uniref:Uncharacterized protein n=1 Tax=Amborella trichopoda TaxID=13333 RepID=U5D2H6_AMBTC|nr:hypothetical protein AMTR_s00052p00200930 [Amborella trichopoda]
MGREVWTNLDMWMAWEICLLLSGAGLWFPIMAVWATRMQATDGGGIPLMLNIGTWIIHGKPIVATDATRGSEDYYPASWQELAKPHSLSGDEDGMKLLSLKRRTRSFFDNLEVIFGKGVDPSREEGLAQAPLARIEG